MKDIKVLKFGEFWVHRDTPILSKKPVPGHVRIIAPFHEDQEGLIRVELPQIPSPWYYPRRFAKYMKRMDMLEKTREIVVERKF